MNRSTLVVCLALCTWTVAPTSARAQSTTLVRAGDNLQAALNAARPGDTLLLEAGATFTGNFKLPAKSGNSYITVRSSAASRLPGPGQRITPSHAPYLPKLVSPNSAPALSLAPGAQFWKLQLLEFKATKDGYGDIIRLGDGSATTAWVQGRNIVLDRVLIRGDIRRGQKRGIALNSGATWIVNSHISNIKAANQDSQAIASWNGPGPYVIENNVIEATGENILFGGATPKIPNLVATKITIRKNSIRKNPVWRNPIMRTPGSLKASAGSGGSLRAGTYGYRVVAYGRCGRGMTCRSSRSAEIRVTASRSSSAVTVSWGAVPGATFYRVYGRTPGGQTQFWQTSATKFVDKGGSGTAGKPPTSMGTRWIVKNLLELKNAQDVEVLGNVFENTWTGAGDQRGYAILMRSENQTGACTWCVTQRVTFAGNIVRHAPAGINIVATDGGRAVPLNRVTISHNLWYDIDPSRWGGGHVPFALVDGGDDVVFDHNTIVNRTTYLLFPGPRRVSGLVWTNNMSARGSYGVKGSSTAEGLESLKTYAPGALFTNNVIAGAKASLYPPHNYFPTMSEWLAEFVDYPNGDLRLDSGSIYRTAGSDGFALGASIGAIVQFWGTMP